MHFWQKISKPIVGMAPMASVTDIAFRELFVQYGSPDIFWTEFVSADGLSSPGREVLQRDLAFTEQQRPIVAQFFTDNTENLMNAVRLAKSLGFDGVDINMGCPEKTIEKQGAGAALIRTPDRAVQLIEAAQKAAQETHDATPLPISVKTRIGYNTDEIDTWIPTLLCTGIDALSVHLRTRKDMSATPARWDTMSRIVALREKYAPKTRILGNGDIGSRSEAEQKIQETGCDGVLVGRSLFGNPWFFNKTVRHNRLSVSDRLQACITHLALCHQFGGDGKPFFNIKRYFVKGYVSDFDGAKELRIALMKTKSISEMQQYLREFLNGNHTDLGDN